MSKRERNIIALIVLIIIVGIIVAGFTRKHQKAIEAQPITIILAPHYGDAMLSLGGLLAQSHTAIVATFFTGTSTATTTESANNAAALAAVGAQYKNLGYTQSDPNLEGDMTQDIQTLIAAYSNKAVDVYGPSTFGTSTDLDQEALYHAFNDVAIGYPNSNVHFYYYENYPGIVTFSQTVVTSLEGFLQNDSGFLLNRVNISLSNSAVKKQSGLLKQYPPDLISQSTSTDTIAADQNYTQNRCGMNSSCEAVYEILQ